MRNLKIIAERALAVTLSTALILVSPIATMGVRATGVTPEVSASPATETSASPAAETSASPEASASASAENGETDSDSVGVVPSAEPSDSLASPSADADKEALEAKFTELEEEFAQIAADKMLLGLIYLSNSYDILAEPAYASASVVTVGSGQSVVITGVDIVDYQIWYKVKLSVNGTEYTGYAREKNVATSEEALLDWREKCPKDPNAVGSQQATGYGDIAQFPESYHAALNALKAAHPNWIFVPQDTKLSWSDVINNEMPTGRNLVPASSIAAYIGTGYNSGGWAQASNGIVQYYMDPRNFMSETQIFQFEHLTYNPTYHTEAGVQAVLNGTFMQGAIPNEGRTYANVIFEAGSAGTIQVSPYHLACRLKQEQGAGTSPLISGQYGYYNYFNIGATGATNAEVINTGISYATSKGWNTVIKSINGGTVILSNSYIHRGQDSLYLQKFDVDASDGSLFSHQYMQNLMAPESEAKNVYKAYNNSGALANPFVFKIPIYGNMPATAVAKPTAPPVPTGVTGFVTRLYQYALSREPDATGLNYWSNLIATNQKSSGDVARSFIYSQEFNLHNYNNSQYVQQLYLTFMGRAYDAEGLNYWAGELNKGKSRDWVFDQFANSAEFKLITATFFNSGATVTPSTPAAPTTPSAPAPSAGTGVGGFVTRLYVYALDRQPDADGLAYWSGMITSRQRSASDVANNFIFSKEFGLHNYSNQEYVRRLYLTFMGREPDAGGLGYWTGYLNQGYGRDWVFGNFAGSQEFKLITSSYGL